MRLLSSWGARPKPAEPAAPAGHRSLALKGLLDGLRGVVRPAVLDLGPPVGSNVDLFSALSCRVSVADLHRLLVRATLERAEPRPYETLLDRLPAPPTGERFAALLTWDLFNYMPPQQIATLMGRLRPALEAGAQLLAFVWTRPRIPLAPLRYRIIDSENVMAEGAREPQRAAPLYKQPELARLLPGFSVKSSFLLRNGIQEYLFTSAAT